jgi:hypothetical protein
MMAWRANQSDWDPLELVLGDMRAFGWRVAAHHDYEQGGQLMTCWLFAHPKGWWVKGEASTDQQALVIARHQAQQRQSRRRRAAMTVVPKARCATCDDKRSVVRTSAAFGDKPQMIPCPECCAEAGGK